MIKVGLTGNIGSGKSVVSKIFEILKVPVYHADEKAKIILESADVIKKLKVLFGNEVIDKYGKPDRKKIAELVFTDNKKLDALNIIIHPAVISDFNNWVESQDKNKYIIMESAILYETGYATLFDMIIIVSSPEQLRIDRVIERDKLSLNDVKNRIKNQLKEKELIKRADFVIKNNDNELILHQVIKLHQQLSEL